MSLKNVEKQEKSTALLEISVDKETFEAACAKAYRKNVGKIAINGFRKGKAPRHMIERIYGKDVFYEDAIEDSYPAALEDAIKESGLEIVARPELAIKEINEEGYTFTAKVALKPEITLSQYKGLEGEYQVNDATDADVDAEIESRRQKSARLEDKDGEAALGDTVVIDYEGFMDGKPFEGGKGEQHNLKLGSGAFIPGFEDQLVGRKANEEFEVTVTFPEDYHAKELAGKPAVFKGIVHSVKSEILPELDDDFASEVSDFDTLAEYKADTKKKLQESREKMAESGFEGNILDQLIEKIEGDIPDAMFDSQLDNLVQDYAYRMQSQGISMEQYFQMTGMDIKGFRETMKPQAERQVKTTLALEYIIKTENLEISEEDIEAEYKKMAEQYSMEIEKVKELVPADGMKHDLQMQKAVELVKENGVKVAPKAEEPKAEETKEAKEEAPKPKRTRKPKAE